MFTLIQSVGIRRALASEAPSLAGAFLIAERFYRFHSFTLECGAFLATWFATSLLWNGVASLIGNRKATDQAS
jgi:hypothetical protein